jgi:hypothetical protein
LDDVQTAPPWRPTNDFRAVRDRHDSFDRRRVCDLLPAVLDLIDVGHVGHRASGVEVGEHDPLMIGREHVGRLGHEMHPAEHDVGCAMVVCGEPGELERVTDRVSPANHLVALVVVSEDQQPVAEGVLGGRDALNELLLGGAGVVVRQRSL